MSALRDAILADRRKQDAEALTGYEEDAITEAQRRLGIELTAPLKLEAGQADSVSCQWSFTEEGLTFQLRRTRGTKKKVTWEMWVVNGDQRTTVERPADLYDWLA